MAEDIFDWDDALPDIEQQEFVILPPGEYNFRIKNYVQKRWDKGKLVGAPYAELEIVFTNDDGSLTGYGKANLTLHAKTLFMVRAFFAAIGYAPEKGQPFTPNWNVVIGSTGRCLVDNGMFIGRDGQKYETNEVDKWLVSSTAKSDDSQEVIPF